MLQMVTQRCGEVQRTIENAITDLISFIPLFGQIMNPIMQALAEKLISNSVLHMGESKGEGNHRDGAEKKEEGKGCRKTCK
jgi:hypothetical protein